MTILVTGGAGFIGANYIMDWLRLTDECVVNVDKLTYAGNLESLESVFDDPRHIFVNGDILDAELMDSILQEHTPRAIINFAAESHNTLTTEMFSISFLPPMLYISPSSPEAWAQAKRATPCAGMNSGKLIPIEEIRIQRSLTS